MKIAMMITTVTIGNRTRTIMTVCDFSSKETYLKLLADTHKGAIIATEERSIELPSEGSPFIVCHATGARLI